MGRWSLGRIWLLCALLALSACSIFEQKVEPPPRSDDPIEVPDGYSVLASDIEIDLSQIRLALERELPRQLWSIGRSGAECIPPQRTQVIGITLKSPPIKCDLNGNVTRGRIVLAGAGRDLIVTMPIQAELTASDIAGIVKSETATARANVAARISISINPNWSLKGRVDINYKWTQPPTVEVLGQKLTFANQADQRLAKIVGRMERTLEREISRLNLRSQIEPVWERGFTVLSLNEKNPPVWLRLTPKALEYDGYSASRNALQVAMRLNASTEIFVGDKPAPSEPIPLPDLLPEQLPQTELALTIPVIAQYSELQPVIERALAKRAERPLAVPVLGERMIEPKSVVAYGTTGSRIAVGVEFEAWKPDDRDDNAVGTVWLTARPVNASNSRQVRFVEPEYQIESNRFSTEVLLEIAKTQDFSRTIEDALTQNFEKDFQGLLSDVDASIAQQSLGDFVLTTEIEEVSTGVLTAYGEGLFLPVQAEGKTQIRYAPN